MRPRTLGSLALLALLGAAGPLAAHPLNPDVQNVGARLAHCSHDLFRARQADGTYLAEIAHERLLRFYTGILEQALRRHSPGEAIRPLEARSVPGRQLLDDVLNVAYAHQVPVRLERRAKLAAFYDLLHSEWTAEELQRVVGARRVRTPRGEVPGEHFGAALLAVAAADLHSRVAWGPGHLVNVIESIEDPASWSLDGVPLTATQFQALVGDLEAALGGMSAGQKINLLGSHCLHFHSGTPGVQAIVAADGTNQDEQKAPPPTFYDVIDAIGEWWRELWDVVPPNGGGPVDTGGGEGGEGGPGEPPGPSERPVEPVCDAECQRKKETKRACEAGTIRACENCDTPPDCLACCRKKATGALDACGEVAGHHLRAGLAEILTGRPSLPTASPDAHPTCETGINNTFYKGCKDRCTYAGEI